MILSKFWAIVENRGAWCAAVHSVAKTFPLNNRRKCKHRNLVFMSRQRNNEQLVPVEGKDQIDTLLYHTFPKLPDLKWKFGVV